MTKLKTLGITMLMICLLSSGTMILSPNASIEAIDGADGLTRAYKRILTAGTVIIREPGVPANNTYFYPVPKEARVLEANITISNQAYSDGGMDLYTKDAFFNVGEGRKEYVHGIPDEPYNGFWGLQNQTRNGWGEQLGIDMVTQSPFNSRFVIPKNATITSATLNITGYQRDQDWKNYRFVSGNSASDSYGQTVRDIGNDRVAYSNPSYVSETGEVYIMISDTSYWGPSRGPGLFSRYGESISESFFFGKTLSMAIGAPRNNSYHGMVRIVSVSAIMTDLFTLDGELASDRFGSEVEIADIDGDDNPDLIVGAPGANSGEGRVMIYKQTVDADVVEFINMSYINGTSGSTSFGKSITIGDMDNDGYDDISVASDQEVKVYLGGPDFDEVADAIFDPVADSGISTIGTAEFIGDQQGSGFDSLAIGSPSSSGGAVSIYHGGSSINTVRDGSISAPTNRGQFGSSIDTGYDTDGDGRPEIAIGAPHSGVQSGWTGIYSASGTPSLMNSFSFGLTGDDYGTSVAFGPDLRGDGYGDLIVGSPGYNTDTEFSCIYLHERYPTDILPVNSPKIRIGGIDVWTYSEDRLGGRTEITTGDLSQYADSAVRSAPVQLSTIYDEYVYLDMQLVVDSPNSFESSSIFDISDYRIEYTIQKNLPDLADAMNNYVNTHDANEFGIVNVPFVFGGKSAGALKIEAFDIVVDSSPEIYGIPTDLHMDEGSVDMRLIDLRQVFEDDNDPDDLLVFNIGKSGENSTYFDINLTDGYFLGVDLNISDIGRNWSGIIEVFASATDTNGGRTNTDDIKIFIDAVNDAPVLTNQPDTTIVQGNQWRFVTSWADAEFQNASFDLENSPDNMTVDDIGTVVWTPNAWQIGRNNYTLILDDGENANEYELYIDVININDPPIFLTEPPVDEEVLIGNTFEYTFVAYDLDPDDIVKYSIVEGPTQNANIDFDTGYLTWTPVTYEPEPQRFVVRAKDLSGSHSDLEFFVNITFLDASPEILSDPVKILDELYIWTYHLQVVDPDEDSYTVELVDPPEGMEYDLITENITWTPADDQVGRFDISIRVNSTIYTIYQNFSLNVLRTPREWTIDFTDIQSGAKVKGSKVKIGGNISVEPSDIEKVYVKVGDNEWMEGTINEDVWFIELDTTTFSDGSYTLFVKGFDGFENSTEQSIEIKIANDEGKVSPVFYFVIILIVILILVAAGGIGFIVHKQMQKKKEEKEKMEKIEEINRSKHEIDDFLDTASTVQDETGKFDNVQEQEIDQDRLDAIDNIFSPAVPGEQAPPQQMVNDEIPEDPLMKATVQENPIDQVTPVDQQVPIEDEVAPDLQEPPVMDEKPEQSQ